MGPPRDVPERHARLQPARELPPLSPGPRGDRAHPSSQRAVLGTAPARGPRARRQPHRTPPTASASRCSRASSCRSARRSRSTSRPSRPTTRPGPTTCRRSACRTWTPEPNGARASALRGGRTRPRRRIRRARPMLVDPATGQPLPLPPPDGGARRLGRAAQLGLGDRRDVRDQLRRLDGQRVRARRQLQPDQPAQLLGQLRGRLHLRRQQVQDQPADPSLERRHVLQRRARQRHRLLGLVGDGDRRRVRLGVLRRDAPDVVQRHDLDRHRRHRARRGDAPRLLADPRQHEARQGPRRPGGRGFPV